MAIATVQPTEAVREPPDGPGWRVQLGAFSHHDNAEPAKAGLGDALADLLVAGGHAVATDGAKRPTKP